MSRTWLEPARCMRSMKGIAVGQVWAPGRHPTVLLRACESFEGVIVLPIGYTLHGGFFVLARGRCDDLWVVR